MDDYTRLVESFFPASSSLSPLINSTGFNRKPLYFWQALRNHFFIICGLTLSLSYQHVRAALPVAVFEDDLQHATPAQGWAYLWNSKGPIGNSANYTPLLPTTDTSFYYDNDSVNGLPGASPGAYVYWGLNTERVLTGQSGGHPGRGLRDYDSGGIERYAIAAYSVDRAGEFSISNSLLTNANASTDGLHVQVYKHTNAIPLLDKATLPGSGKTASFDVNLGHLQAGDTIYVAVGARDFDHNDSFALRYSITDNNTVADSNIAQTKKVIPIGVFGSVVLNLAGSLTDGIFFPNGESWSWLTASWSGATDDRSFIIDLTGTYRISSFIVQADANDTYQLEYNDNGVWKPAWTILAVTGSGLQTHKSKTLPSSIVTDRLRFTATSGDGNYAVSEIQAIGELVSPQHTVISDIAPSHLYKLNQSLADEKGGPSLISLGGSMTSSGYQFSAGQGLSLSNVFTDGDYTIDMALSLADPNGWKKILDFNNLTSDVGVHSRDSTLEFYPETAGRRGPSDAFAANIPTRITLTRDLSGTVTGYVNGIQQISFNDSDTKQSIFSGPNSIAYFFRDDQVTNNEQSAGVASYIQIFDTALSRTHVATLSAPVLQKNVAQGKKVELNGLFEAAALEDAGSLVNGAFVYDSNFWSDRSVWWSGSLSNNVVIDLAGPNRISSFAVQANATSTYLLEYNDNGIWKAAWSIPEVPGSQMKTRTSGTLTTPIVTDKLRFTATGGAISDYAVSEIQAFGEPIIEQPVIAPDAPTLGSPASGIKTNQPIMTVIGSSSRGTEAQLSVNGVVQGNWVPVINERFEYSLTLAEGLNRITAVVKNAKGTSPISSPVLVTLDTSKTSSPNSLTANSQAQGKIRLSWTPSTDAASVGSVVFRSTTSFDASAQATRITPNPLTVNSFEDIPVSDGTYFYRVASINALGTLSTLSNIVQTLADSVAPKALSLVLSPQGKTDEATGRVGQGRVNVALTLSEALQMPPYLSIVPQGGTPIPVELIKTDSTTYSGSFLIDANTPSGVANALFSARDAVGNRGTDIEGAASLNIDTEGPILSAITLSPVAPIKNDTAQTVQATFTFSKAVVGAPQIKYLLSGAVRSSVMLSGLSQINSTTYTASFALPTDAGLGGSETLSFNVQAKDDLDNIATRITAANSFQVYKGTLPPLNVPFALTTKAQVGGKVKLTWQIVEGAHSYQIYRQAPGQTALQPLIRVSSTEYIDQAPSDGAYKYAIASVRQSNSQESVSGMSAMVEVFASATAPGAPQNFKLQLTGQGIYATWQPPLASTVDSYSLYRASGRDISSIAGLSPLKTNIKSPATYDTNPSAHEGTYVVTALDAAGNESAISNSAYLNASLLPVRDLKVEQTGNALPSIRWAAPNGNVSGYLVYVGSDASKIKLTANPIAATQFTDTGYTTGERRYTVASVDANQEEMPRSIVLPNVTTHIVSGLPIKRGVMNRLHVQVANTSTTSLDGVRVVIRLPINKETTEFKDHKSEIFTLTANQTRLVPIIVGGYADLPGAPQAQISVEIAPNEGELVRMTRNQTVEVTEGGLVVGMATDAFTRGSTGKLKLTIENTTDVDVELLTATNDGSQDSTELRFKILDADGNVLVTQPYKQVFGSSVVTLTNGQTVARIPAGSHYMSEVFNLNVPVTSGNRIRVKLEVDKLRYHTGQEDEVQIAGRGSEKNISLLDSAYFGEVTRVMPISSFGDQDVIITGRAIDRQTQAALPNTRLKLVLNQQGFERQFSVLTDASGSFNYVFKPTLTDSGLYKVSAVHPDISDRPEHKAFTINRVTVTPAPYKVDVPKNYPFTIPFTAKAEAGTSATNLRFVLDAASQITGQLPVGISVQLPAPVNLVERQSLNVPVIFTANNDAQPSGSLILNVVSDEHAGLPIGQVKVDYTLSDAKPYLISTPSFIETGLARGSSQIESLTVKNNGLQDALNLKFTLTKPDGSPALNWASIASQANGTLAIGETRSIDVSFTPPVGTADGVYEFKLNVAGDNVPAQAVNVYAGVTQSGQGSVLFKVADIYTATVGKDGRLIQGLAGSTITLQNEDVLTVSYEFTTDVVGEALFQNIPSGRYKFRAKATNHQDVSGRLVIKPSITANQPLFLNYNLINVEWSVREIAIQDRYEITLNATYETDVPAAVVMLEPLSVNLPRMNPGDVFYGELTLTNYGLIRAEHLQQQLPKSDGYFRYEFLVDAPSVLEAKQRVTIPYRVIALQSFESAANSGTASGGGCSTYSGTYSLSCDFTCANGTQSPCGASTSWLGSAHSSSCPAPGAASGAGMGGPLGASSSTPVKLPGKKCASVPGSSCSAAE